MRKILFFILLISNITIGFAARNVKTIHVIPDNAVIYLNGNEVGNGVYTIKFGRNDDFVMLKFEAAGYLTRNVKLMKDNPKETISYKLIEDEAQKNSVGSGSGEIDMANKWMTITCKKGMTEAQVWRRIMGVVVDNFETVEVRDKDAGWIKTAWTTKSFDSGQSIRTRLEVRIVVAGDEEDLQYKVRVSSEIKDSECTGESCFVKYNRVLRDYYDVIVDLQNSLGANN